MKQQAVQLLHALVATPSVSGDEQNAVKLLVERMAELAFDQAYVDGAGNAVGIRGAGEHDIVLLGHIDTVPGDIPVRVEKGILYGRGAVDAKGPLAAFVMAAARAELPDNHRFVVIGAVEEESATSKGARFAVEQFRPKACIIGEPSGVDGVTLGYKGRLLLDYALSQPMSHTAGKQGGVAERAVAFYNALMRQIAQFNSDKPKLFDQLLPSIRELRTTSDGLANSVYLKLGIRLPPALDVAAFQQMVVALAGEAAVDFYGYEPAVTVGRGDRLAKLFGRTLLQHDLKPRFKRKTGTSDMNVVAPVWQCPMVAYGPGDSALDHTPNEHLRLDDYQRAIDILMAVLAKANQL